MNNAHKSIVINGKFLLSDIEGLTRVACEVTHAIDELLSAPEFMNHRVYLYGPPGSKTQINLENIEIFEVGKLSGFLWEQISLPLALRGQYVLNFTNTAPLFTKNGCVVVHDAQFRSTPASHNFKSKVLYGIVTPIAAKRYRQVVSVSNFAREQIRNYSITKRDDIFVIYNGADHMLRQKWSDEILKKFGIQPKEYILAHSAFHAHKNLKTVLNAVGASRKLSEKLILFGSASKHDLERHGLRVPESARRQGPSIHDLERHGLRVPDGVRFLGRVTDQELATLMRSASVFLFPSTTEGFGLPPVESMALGCPTICSNAGAMPEVCGDGVYFVPAMDCLAWTEAIETILNDSHLQSGLSQKGLEISKRYRWNLAARKYLEIITPDV